MTFKLTSLLAAATIAGGLALAPAVFAQGMNGQGMMDGQGMTNGQGMMNGRGGMMGMMPEMNRMMNNCNRMMERANMGGEHGGTAVPPARQG